MGGHVNMMDDFIISNLSPELLRSSLRSLLSFGSVNQKHFVQHVRDAYTERPVELTEPSRLFPEPEQLSAEGREYIENTRCVLGCKMTSETLRLLTHLVNALKTAKATWSESSPLSNALQSVDGDIVQAMQATKESRSSLGPQVKDQLTSLHASLAQCQAYCLSQNLPFPFNRASRQVRDTLTILYHESISEPSANPGTSLTLNIPPPAHIETFTLGHRPHLPRLFTGLWQLSSQAWGSSSTSEQDKALISLAEQGFTAADMADHYGDAELIYGDFRARLPSETQKEIFAATKWCVFRSPEQAITREWVLDAVKERGRRLSGRADLLQFHWFDYEDKRYLEILAHLFAISLEKPGLVGQIGLCNFDSEHVVEACEFLYQRTGSYGLVSNQVQFSLLDSRPLQKMTAVCEKYGLKLLTYGTLAGGLLSEKYSGQPAPENYSKTDPMTPSQRKYLDVIHTWGTWPEYQSLLTTLSHLAKVHEVSLSNIATRWVLQQVAVGAVLVGTRLGVSAHGKENLKTYSFGLSEEEMTAIDQVALGKGNEKVAMLIERMGDCGGEYRGMH